MIRKPERPHRDISFRPAGGAFQVMSVPCRAELSVLDYDERELVRSTHYPDIGEKTRSDLEKLRSRIRDMQDKERSNCTPHRAR
jgi:hypothetical protein